MLAFELKVQAALGLLYLSALVFNYFCRQQKDFAVCGQRPDGSALWTPASLSGKRLDLNPLPLGLFVLTCSFVRLTCYFWGTKNGLSLPKSPFCYQSIISPSTAQLCVFVTLTLCIVPISDSSPFTSVMMNSPLLPLISPSL